MASIDQSDRPIFVLCGDLADSRYYRFECNSLVKLTGWTVGAEVSFIDLPIASRGDRYVLCLAYRDWDPISLSSNLRTVESRNNQIQAKN